MERYQSGATLDTSDSPGGERSSSPVVITTKKANSHSQLALPSPAWNAAAAMIRYAAPQPTQPSAILITVEGSLPRADWRAHKATTNGVNAKIMNGLKDWNQVVGISVLQNHRLTVRSV